MTPRLLTILEDAGCRWMVLLQASAPPGPGTGLSVLFVMPRHGGGGACHVRPVTSDFAEVLLLGSRDAATARLHRELRQALCDARVS